MSFNVNTLAESETSNYKHCELRGGVKPGPWTMDWSVDCSGTISLASLVWPGVTDRLETGLEMIMPCANIGLVSRSQTDFFRKKAVWLRETNTDRVWPRVSPCKTNHSPCQENNYKAAGLGPWPIDRIDSAIGV